MFLIVNTILAFSKTCIKIVFLLLNHKITTSLIDGYFTINNITIAMIIIGALPQTPRFTPLSAKKRKLYNSKNKKKC